MINEIKTIIQNYLNNEKFCCLLLGTVVDGGVRVSDKLVVPFDLITGTLKNKISYGKRVRMLRDHGGQQFFILEVIEDD
ncbi:MAG: helicase [Clostridia bacterium]|jgi:hypothetical protein|nr:helicase [Clostridia bacterium]